MNKDLLLFLKELKNNNNKEWFDVNRKRYEQLRIEFIQLIEKLIAELSKFDSSLATLDAKKTIFRINRDIRFSKNKSPYKTNFGAFICADGKKSGKGGYYLHIEPKQCFIAGGMWQPEAPLLSKIRQEIDYNGAEFTKIVTQKKLKESFGGLDESDMLKNMPKGYDADTKHATYLQHKSYVLIKSLSDTDITSPQLVKQLVADYKLVYPLNTFLNRVFDDEN
jgi:uncharacterized protein (TIGR02453 family)